MQSGAEGVEVEEDIIPCGVVVGVEGCLLLLCQSELH